MPAHDRPVAREDLAAALDILGKRHLVLSIHDVSFPGSDDEDLGRGSPYSGGGRAFLAFVRRLGFTGVQLGPQGQTSRYNPSPYDGALFARDILSLALRPLADDPAYGNVLPRADLDDLLRGRPPRPRQGVTERADYAAAWPRQLAALASSWHAFTRRRAAADPAVADLAEAFDGFAREHAGWLAPAGLYEVLSTAYRTGGTWSGAHGLRVSFDGSHWRTWPRDQELWVSKSQAAAARRAGLQRTYARELEFLAFCQLLLARQHAALRAELAARPGLPALRLFGDLQVGISVGDTWALHDLFLPGYAMGAPPSRTNPDGQPWGYPVLDPRLYHGGPGDLGPALRLVAARTDAMLRDYDGLRVDHPHGLVCPWVYRTDEPDAYRAVQGGARLFESPCLSDHPRLAAYAIARADQLDLALPRHADGWVRALDDAQVVRYGAQLDVVLAAARAHGRAMEDVLCEVLSTQPYPLQRVLEGHGLGRFRVTQKADLTNPNDVYRSENARPEDWVMLGNHDTPPIWRLAASWHKTPLAAAQTAYLCGRLGSRSDDDPLRARMLADPAALVHAKFADLLVCPARQVAVFMSDLFGAHDIYNAPGVVDPANWTLRLRPGCEAAYWPAAARGAALDLGWALAIALRSRGPDGATEHAELIARLERGLGRPC
ncbi:4-alpha-glucanotransferase [Nannocystis punicea]|uniref:4-alpha-glucanotransferase n=1 Tax=Nannocystis punicea TaxID=2995304 RepID=A0ABY7HAW9_9BACT|nr:4-alpha-glucanotransferase [Nannocystis poenicansa]WAS96199.1 4-alpha-glucanotransferase [Nannocystis poenicansa]